MERMVYINNGGKVGDLEIVPHAIVDEEIQFFDLDTAKKIMDVILAGGVVDFEGGIENK